MDKLKEQLAVVKEHSFWILCGGILLVSVVSWYMSTNHLQQQQKKYKGEIETAVSTLNAVKSTPDHPNDSTNKGMDGVMQKFGEDVYQAWTQLAAHQEQVFIWGGIFGTDGEFQKEVRPLRPIETKVDEASTAINLDNRRLYRDYIDDEIPKLADIILAKWQVDAQSLGGAGGAPGAAGGAAGGAPGGGLSGPMGGIGPMGGGAGMPGMPGGQGSAAKDDDPNVVVIWDEANQKEITQVHFGMAMNSNASPSTLEVLYAQEDLWVFQNLMGIVKATNGDATRKHEAAIKYIQYLRIGRSAGDVAGQVIMAGKANSGSNNMMEGGGAAPGGAAGMMGAGGMGAGDAAGMMGAGGMGPAAGGPGMPAGGAAGAGGAGAQVATTAASDRYVDLSYASIKDINRLRNALKGSSSKTEDMLLAVAKRMPVRMQFTMDQRKLTTLLAECGNSKLPVEVRQVRINRGTASSLGGGGGMAGGGGGMMGGAGGMMGGAAGGGMMPGAPAGGGEGGGTGGMMGMGGMMGGAGGGSRPATGIASSKEDPNEISVEIYGIVYIYNPPERKLLGLTDPVVPVPPATVPGPVTTPTGTAPAAPTPPVNAGAATGR